MNNQLSHYISIEPDFFQELEGEFGVKITGKLANFLRTVEIVRPDRFMTSEMKWCGVGRKKLDREKFFRAFLLKAEFNLPTTKVLIESLRTNTSWRLLCGWEYSSKIPSEATFSRAFSEFAKAEQNRKIKIEEARANLEAEKLNAQAEIERAKGAAEAIKIENGSITPTYIQYLWVRQQSDLSNKTVIYIPTETNLPLL